MAHKAGFVNIIGNPNVGKSTLMNALMGEKLSIVTHKSQTTRHRILGIVNGEDFQIVFSDTPGIIQPKYELQQAMLNFVETAIIDADIILYVTDVIETIDKNAKFIDKINNTDIPVILIINKIDLSDDITIKKMAEEWSKVLPKATIIAAAAKLKFNHDAILKLILEKLPEHPAYYEKDELTDKTERFFVSEIIREKILITYDKEIPYTVEVEVETFKEEKDITRIKANIHVSRESLKSIIIGKQGAALKKVGTYARRDIETFLDKKVFLELFVKVTTDWRERPAVLKKFGYIDTK
jgi:GTPase